MDLQHHLDGPSVDLDIEIDSSPQARGAAIIREIKDENSPRIPISSLLNLGGQIGDIVHAECAPSAQHQSFPSASQTRSPGLLRSAHREVPSTMPAQNMREMAEAAETHAAAQTLMEAHREDTYNAAYLYEPLSPWEKMLVWGGSSGASRSVTGYRPMSSPMSTLRRSSSIISASSTISAGSVEPEPSIPPPPRAAKRRRDRANSGKRLKEETKGVRSEIVREVSCTSMMTGASAMLEKRLKTKRSGGKVIS